MPALTGSGMIVKTTGMRNNSFCKNISKCSDFAFLNIEKRTLTEQAVVLKCKIMK